MTDLKAKRDRRFPVLSTTLVATFALTAVIAAFAAEIPTGTWSGTVTPPEGESVPGSFIVSETDGVLGISLDVMGMIFQTREIEVTDDSIHFTWSPGVDVRCELDLQEDLSYSGPCTDTNDDTGYITMVPPE